MQLHYGGGCEIRTHAPVKANGFQDRLVMTTSITLRVRLFSFRFANFLEKVLEGTIFCFVRKAKTSGVARDFESLRELATANFQDRLVMTASIFLRIQMYICIRREYRTGS